MDNTFTFSINGFFNYIENGKMVQYMTNIGFAKNFLLTTKISGVIL